MGQEIRGEQLEKNTHLCDDCSHDCTWIMCSCGLVSIIGLPKDRCVCWGCGANT